MAAVGNRPVSVGRPAWSVVAEQELRDLWLAGRGLPLMLACSVLLSVACYLVAANQSLNALRPAVAQQRTLDAGGFLPLAVTMLATVLLLMGFAARRRRGLR